MKLSFPVETTSARYGEVSLYFQMYLFQVPTEYQYISINPLHSVNPLHPVSGRAYTFGSNQWGQLALGHGRQTNKPSFVKSLKGRPITHIACGRSHTLFASKEEVYACGGNGEHQVNSSNDDEVLSPYLIPSLSGITVKRFVIHVLMVCGGGGTANHTFILASYSRFYSRLSGY